MKAKKVAFIVTIETSDIYVYFESIYFFSVQVHLL